MRGRQYYCSGAGIAVALVEERASVWKHLLDLMTRPLCHTACCVCKERGQALCGYLWIGRTAAERIVGNVAAWCLYEQVNKF